MTRPSDKCLPAANPLTEDDDTVAPKASLVRREIFAWTSSPSTSAVGSARVHVRSDRRQEGGRQAGKQTTGVNETTQQNARAEGRARVSLPQQLGQIAFTGIRRGDDKKQHFSRSGVRAEQASKPGRQGRQADRQSGRAMRRYATNLAESHHPHAADLLRKRRVQHSTLPP